MRLVTDPQGRVNHRRVGVLGETTCQSQDVLQPVFRIDPVHSRPMHGPVDEHLDLRYGGRRGKLDLYVDRRGLPQQAEYAAAEGYHQQEKDDQLYRCSDVASIVASVYVQNEVNCRRPLWAKGYIILAVDAPFAGAAIEPLARRYAIIRGRRCSLPKIYTKRGDDGETGLLYGGRVSKADLRCEAYGTVDEAVSALGLARSLVQEERLKEVIMEVQRELFVVGGELATDASEYPKLVKHFSVVTPVMVDRLEALIDELNDQMTLPNAFIIPGATPASGALDMARSILRRAERRVVTLKEEGLLHNPVVLQYLNRLADLAFVMARYEDRHLPIEALTGRSSARADRPDGGLKR